MDHKEDEDKPLITNEILEALKNHQKKQDLRNEEKKELTGETTEKVEINKTKSYENDANEAEEELNRQYKQMAMNQKEDIQKLENKVEELSKANRRLESEIDTQREINKVMKENHEKKMKKAKEDLKTTNDEVFNIERQETLEQDNKKLRQRLEKFEEREADIEYEWSTKVAKVSEAHTKDRREYRDTINTHRSMIETIIKFARMNANVDELVPLNQHYKDYKPHEPYGRIFTHSGQPKVPINYYGLQPNQLMNRAIAEMPTKSVMNYLPKNSWEPSVMSSNQDIRIKQNALLMKTYYETPKADAAKYGESSGENNKTKAEQNSKKYKGMKNITRTVKWDESSDSSDENNDNEMRKKKENPKKKKNDNKMNDKSKTKGKSNDESGTGDEFNDNSRDENNSDDETKNKKKKENKTEDIEESDE
ncbi:myb-like protein X [Oppia nitens]|uniref:myb-like protein X n=1 Tax=Oppia nitens TaxID=1686743 RepID=UPI0023DA0D7C|nr:myb-like protein X [Oppia nitens]